MSFTQWVFEPDVPKADYKEKDPMCDVITFGKYKGAVYGNIMRSPDGRRYMQWLLLQKCDSPEWKDAHEKRQNRIKACFDVYEKAKNDLLQKQNEPIQSDQYESDDDDQPEKK